MSPKRKRGIRMRLKRKRRIELAPSASEGIRAAGDWPASEA